MMDNKWNIGEGGEMQATVEKSRQMHTRTDMEQFVNSLGETRDKMF